MRGPRVGSTGRRSLRRSEERDLRGVCAPVHVVRGGFAAGASDGGVLRQPLVEDHSASLCNRSNARGAGTREWVKDHLVLVCEQAHEFTHEEQRFARRMTALRPYFFGCEPVLPQGVPPPSIPTFPSAAMRDGNRIRADRGSIARELRRRTDADPNASANPPIGCGCLVVSQLFCRAERETPSLRDAQGIAVELRRHERRELDRGIGDESASLRSRALVRPLVVRRVRNHSVDRAVCHLFLCRNAITTDDAPTRLTRKHIFYRRIAHPRSVTSIPASRSRACIASMSARCCTAARATAGACCAASRAASGSPSWRGARGERAPLTAP